MHQESSWITKCSTSASWSLIIFVCPLLLRWLFQRFPLTAAAKWARLKVTDWEYVFKCIYKCIYRFPFLLHFSLPLTDDKITHLQFKLQHTWLFWKKKKRKSIAHPYPSPFTGFHTLFPCLLTLVAGLTRDSHKASDPLLWPSPCHPSRSISRTTAFPSRSKLTVDYESFRSKSDFVTQPIGSS